MSLVAGIDSSTQSCKVVVRDASTGRLLRAGRAPHPDGTEVDPEQWWTALLAAIDDAGGLDDVDAIAIGGQQHGLVALGSDGLPVRDALLWNDSRSSKAAVDLTGELGADVLAAAVGSVPRASYTSTKLRWLRDHEPENAARVAAVALPHDYLTWRLAGHGANDPDFTALATDRSEASGTGYWSPAEGRYRDDLLEHVFGRAPILPRVLGPAESAGRTGRGIPGVRPDAALGPGAGDNAGAALGLGAGPGDVVISIGTSGTVFAVTEQPVADASGLVAGFADASGRFLPLVATLNAARVVAAAENMLRVNHEEFSALALSAPPGSSGLVLLPYLEGERTPNLPDARGSFHGLSLATARPSTIARAMVEGMLCGLADGLDAITVLGVGVERVLLVGGGARSEAVRRIAPEIFGVPITVPPAAEYVADGAARQAAWVLGGSLPSWSVSSGELHRADGRPDVREQYRAAQRALGYPTAGEVTARSNH